MVFRMAIVAAGVVLGSGGVVAHAADLLARHGVYDSYTPAPVTRHTAWYVRGDAGYALQDEPEVREAGAYDLDHAALDNTWTLGLGIGRYFTPNLRGDITWDYRFESDVRGFTLDGPYPGDRRFSLASNVILANIYYDFRRDGHITPYIGAGIGAARHASHAGEIIPTPCGCAADIEDGNTWSFAAALMAGVSINLGRDSGYWGSVKDAPVAAAAPGRWHLDAGYRFLYLGDAHTGPVTASTGPGPVIGGDKVKDIAAHELRLGLRYDIR